MMLAYWALFVVVLLMGGVFPVEAFVVVPQQQQAGWLTSRSAPMEQQPQHPVTRGSCSSSTALNMFMGSDGGILGIGGPELVRHFVTTILPNKSPFSNS